MLTYNMDVTPESVWKRTTPTKQEKSEPVSDWRRVRIFRFLRV